MSGRFEGGVAEPLPGRGQDDDVAGGVGLGDVETLAARPEEHGTRGIGDQPIELGAVAVLCRTEQPVRSADGSGQSDATSNVLAQQRTCRLKEEPGLGGHAEHPTGATPVGHHRVRVERVVDRGGGDVVRGQLTATQFVDGDMRPRRVVRRWGHVRQVRPLPREVVMVQEGRPAGTHGRGQGGGGWVERERAQILNDDHIGRRQRIGQLPVRGRRRSVDCETVEEDVDRAGSSHRDNLPPQLHEGVAPFRGLDRDPVAAPQPEREQRGGRHGAAL